VATMIDIAPPPQSAILVQQMKIFFSPSPMSRKRREI